MAARRGTIRTELKVEGTEKGRQDMTRFRRGTETELSGVARAFKGIQGSVSAFNQYKETFNQVASIVRSFGAAVRDLAQRTPETAAALANLDRSANSLAGAFVRGLNEGNRFADGLTYISDALNSQDSVVRRVGASISWYLEIWWRYLPSIYRILTAIRNITGDQQVGEQGALIPIEQFGSEPDTSAADAIREAQERERDIRSRRRAIEGGGGNDEADAADAARRAAREARDLIAESERILDQQADEDIRRWGERWTAEREAADNSFRLWGEAAIARNDLERQAHEQRMAWADEEKQQAAELVEYQREQIRATIGKVEGYANAVMTVGGAVADVFGQLAAEQAEGSKQAERYKKIQGGILAGIAFVNAAIEVAKAIGAYPDVVGIAAHAASAVAYIAAGALALRNLGGQASRPTGTSGFTAAEKKPQTSQQGQSAGTTIITLGASDGRLARELQRTANGAARSGLDRSMGGAGRYF